jgi:hypothetical protein
MATLPPINSAIPRCPRCHAKDVIKKGRRKTRPEAHNQGNLAEARGISTWTVHNMVKNGTLACVRLGKRILIAVGTTEQAEAKRIMKIREGRAAEDHAPLKRLTRSSTTKPLKI